ncbi:hypothetical protein [Rhodococcus sp. LB1]|uniref:hypothetical protein n=1 Tax=Rhodococcus sp. LB1 TaxID=1807499 RepID=UPI000A43AA68|nr:hypothetical protein [Rhodococcus sp. LB1]
MGAYNGNPANIDTLAAGTPVWRVHWTSSAYPPNAFNRSNIAPWVDARTLDTRTTAIPAQGRFEPVHDPAVCPDGAALGGYLYLGLSVGAVVAEGILRGQDIPPDLIIRKRLLADKSLTQLVLDDDIDIAILDGQRNLIRLGQDASLTACTWRDYGQTRRTATDILTNTPAAHGLRYECRHGRNELALMLIDGRTAPALTVVRSAPLDVDGWARDAVTASLLDDFNLTSG